MNRQTGSGLGARVRAEGYARCIEMDIGSPAPRGQLVRLLAVLLLSIGIIASALAQNAALSGVFTNPSQTDAEIKKAIEAGVKKVNFVIRSMARSRLTNVNPAVKRVAIERANDAITVTFDERKPVRMPTDGSTIKWTREDGQIYDVQLQQKDEQLVQTFKNEEGQRTNTYKLSPDGKTLTLEVELRSERLPEPVRYQLTFARTQP